MSEHFPESHSPDEPSAEQLEHMFNFGGEDSGSLAGVGEQDGSPADTESQSRSPENPGKPRTYEDWLEEVAALEHQRDETLRMAAESRNPSLLDENWFNILLGRLYTAQQEVAAHRAEAERRDDSQNPTE